MKQVLKVKNNLKEKREEMRKDRRWLAEKIGSTVITIAAIENEEFTPSIYLCLLLSAALDVEVKDMFWLELQDVE